MSKERLNNLPDELKEHIKTEKQLKEFARDMSIIATKKTHDFLHKEVEFLCNQKESSLCLDVYMAALHRLTMRAMEAFIAFEDYPGAIALCEILEDISKHARAIIKNETNNNNKKESSETEV